MSDYDPATAQAISDTAKRVDFFYGSLSLNNKDKRTYKNFAKTMLRVDVSFHALHMHASMQSSNQETLKMIGNTSKLWSKYKEKFKNKNRYSNVTLRLHRKRLNEMFGVMLKAEISKK
ncbi:MAG: hypothetical protein Q9M28_09680 [Mariprofundaceae bacterium]|nr:hypothetical protein [Mariprofundaceae bacterium]